jgi:hypothetical protein
MYDVIYEAEIALCNINIDTLQLYHNRIYNFPSAVKTWSHIKSLSECSE